MTTSVDPVHLSGSTSGKPIPVNSTSTTLHVAVSGSTSFDDVTLYAANVTGAAATLTLEWGGTTDPGELGIKAYSIPANSSQTLVFRGRMNGGLTISAKSGTANAINVTGTVNRYS